MSRWLTGLGAAVLVAVAGLVLVGLGAADVGAAFPGRNGKIAYCGGGGQSYGTYVMNPDGSEQTRISTLCGEPAWSPDGTKIAFSQTTGIYAMNADGSDVRQLSDTPGDANPAWSPDGTKIAFNNTEIWVMNADGSGRRKLTKNAAVARHPAWSPDGTEIAFDSNRRGRLEIYVISADGRGQHNLGTGGTLTASDYAPNWSPDGTEIAFSREDLDPYYGACIFVVSAGGGHVREVTHSGRGGAYWDEDPVWSPDGTKIVYWHHERGGVPLVYVVNADGGGLRNLTTGPWGSNSPDWQTLPLASPPPPTPPPPRASLRR